MNLNFMSLYTIITGLIVFEILMYFFEKRNLSFKLRLTRVIIASLIIFIVQEIVKLIL